MRHLLAEDRRPLRLLLPAVALATSLCGQAAAQESLPVLARIGPWPVASRLIGYGDRLWLANSVKGVNHNSADIYSYNPLNGGLRYERHLFSQDAGQPVVANGRLYWPFEDSRFSLGWGHYLSTDGREWRYGTIPTAQIFHTHAMVAFDRGLVAATSAWRAGIQVSTDEGATWREAYDHPTPERRVSRVTELVTVGDFVLGRLRGPEGRRLLRFGGVGATALPGWPQDKPILGLAVFRDALYGLVREDGRVSVWRSDGLRSEKVAGLGWQPVDLTANDRGLWALGNDASGGSLWQSVDGVEWLRRYSLSGGKPREVALYAGRPYVAGAGDDGRAMLWGPPPPARVAARSRAENLREVAPRRGAEAADWRALDEALDQALGDSESYDGHGRVLRDLVYRAALAGPPAGFFEQRLARFLPERTLSLIGGAVEVPAAKLGRWILLWGMAVAGRGRVPLDLIREPWNAPSNQSEKYFEAAPAAIWAASLVGQKDRATVDALIQRLGRAGDPDWLQGDVVGALTALTGQRFAYDVAAWREWWKDEAAAWPE